MSPTPWKPTEPAEIDTARVTEVVEQIIELMDRRREADTATLVMEANRELRTQMTAKEYARIPYDHDTREFVVRALRLAQRPAPETGLSRDDLLAIAHRLREEAGISPEERSHLVETFAANTTFPDAARLFDASPAATELRMLPPAQIVDECLAFQPAASADDVWEIARAWSRFQAGQHATLRGASGLALLDVALARVDVPELRELLKLARDKRPLRLRTLMQRLGLPVPSSVPPSQRTSEPPTSVRLPVAPRRVLHSKFGEGTVLSESMRGSDVVLEIDFGGERKKLLSSFVTPVDGG